MKIIIQIIKGVLLWMTVLSILCFIVGGFESLIEAERWVLAIIWPVINIILVYLCYHILSYKECYKLLGCQWLERLIGQ